jgi:hypothetical protein
MEINHGGVYAFVSQKILDGDDVKSFLKQVGRIGVPERMDGHLLVGSCVPFGLPYGPLHSPLRIPAVEVPACPSVDLLIPAVEKPEGRSFGVKIGFEPPDQDGGKGDVTVLLAFALPDMEHLPVEIEAGNFQVSFETAEPATIK